MTTNLQTGSTVIQEPADQALLDRYFSGDREALVDLAEQYTPRLYSFGLRMCGNVEDAKDLIQDTLLNVVRYLGRFRGETKLKNWIYRLATSACIRKRRRGKNQPDRELSLEDLRPEFDKNSPPEVPDWSESPVDQLLTGELRDRLGQAIGQLPPQYRLVFALRDLEGFSTAEVADMLNLTPQNVKTRLHRARAFLRNELWDYYQGQSPGSNPSGGGL